jgi:hypothetical protein
MVLSEGDSASPNSALVLPLAKPREFESARLSQEKTRADALVFSWRRRGDSNSRFRSPQTNDLANRPLQPLGYSSVPKYCNTEQGPQLDL